MTQEIDPATTKSENLYGESTIGFLGKFAYSADMKEMILVDVKGLYIESSLYHLDASRKKINITPDFIRADFPVWSSKNNLIAFLGTKHYPGSNDEIKNFSQTEKLLDHPWRLYIYDPKNSTTNELPLDIVGPSSLKWSPDGTMLTFSGKYEGVEGIWIVNNVDTPESITVTRIIKDLATFDFSPNGKSIAFAYIGLQNKDKQNRLYLVSLP